MFYVISLLAASSSKLPIMKWICFVVAVLYFCPVWSQIKKLSAETTVQNVVIFSSGARVERSSIVNLLPGRTEVSFSGLSNQLEQQSVQLKADATITLLSVQTTRDFLSQRKIEQDERSYLDRISNLNEKIQMDAKLLDVYKNEEAMLIKNQSIGGQAGVKATDLKEALDLQRQRLTEVYQKELELQKRIQEEQNEVQRSRNQLREFSKKRDSVSYTVTALVETKETRNVKFQLLYNIKDAGWYPAYDIRVKSVTEPLSALMNANVFQRSGETWKDVQLFLSTGNPNDNATPSYLQPWMLNFFDPSINWNRFKEVRPGTISGRVTDESGSPIANVSVVVKGTSTGSTTDANGFFRLQGLPTNNIVSFSAVGYQPKVANLGSGYYGIILSQSINQLQEVVVTAYGVEKEEAPLARSIKIRGIASVTPGIQTVSVATQYQPTTIVYKIDDKYTLETDGKTTTIGIREFSIPALYDYYSAPKVDPATFLTARILNWQDYDLQSGEANLYFEGNYLGKTYIDLSETADTLSLSLGKDNGIKLNRKLVKEFTTKKFIGSNKTESREYEISIRNNKRVPVTVKVVDQFPVSVTKEITVDDQKAPEAQVDKDTGFITWMVTLEPGQEKKLFMSYSIKYPKDRKVLLD